jgi:hypothetical protein
MLSSQLTFLNIKMAVSFEAAIFIFKSFCKQTFVLSCYIVATLSSSFALVAAEGCLNKGFLF